jgi:hypothetical protein
MYVEGEVVNTTTTPLADVQVQVQLFDVQQNVISTVVVTPAFKLSLPGQINRFSAFLGPTPSPTPSYAVRIIGWRPVENAQAVPVSVPDVVINGTDSLGRVNVVIFTATIRNDTTQPLTNVVAVARTAGCPGLLSKSIGSLAPGQTTTWRDSLFCTLIANESVKVDAQGTTVR